MSLGAEVSVCRLPPTTAPCQRRDSEELVEKAPLSIPYLCPILKHEIIKSIKMWIRAALKADPSLPVRAQ